jgi:hypothetical protein
VGRLASFFKALTSFSENPSNHFGRGLFL